MSEEWTEITGSAINLKKQPGPHVGAYIGSEERAGQFGKEHIHSFIGEDGVPFSLYGMGSLDRMLVGRVPSGTKVRVTYLGKKKTSDGKRDFNAVRVEVAKGTQLGSDEPPTYDPPFDPDNEIPA